MKWYDKQRMKNLRRKISRNIELPSNLSKVVRNDLHTLLSILYKYICPPKQATIDNIDSKYPFYYAYGGTISVIIDSDGYKLVGNRSRYIDIEVVDKQDGRIVVSRTMKL